MLRSLRPQHRNGLTPAASFLTLVAMPAKDDSNRLQGHVPATYVRLLFEYLDRHGVDSAALLGEPPPDAGSLRYPVTRWKQLMERAATRLGDPLLGLHLGQTITPAHLGVMGYVLQACGSLGAAVQRFERYQRLMYDVSPMRQRIESDALCLVWGVERGRPGALVDEAALATLMQFVRRLTGRPLAALAIDFVNRPPADLKPYRDFFACPVRYGQAETVVRFPLAALALPLVQPDPALVAVLERQADALLDQYQGLDVFEQSVRRSILRLSPLGEPGLAAVAAELHLSTRTLRRRLEQRGLAFRLVLDDTRRRLAEDYLRDPGLQLAEVAQLLGYSEQSAFTRAFRRWTGSTPAAHRRNVSAA